MTESIQKPLSWVALLLVAVVPLLLLFTMSMPMDHDGGGCPFMQGGTSLCPMSVFDHIASWQSTFTIVLIEILIFAIPVLVLVWAWLVIPKPERPPGYRRRSYPATPFLQELFSSGILNPKAP